jgi:predicted ABC-type ATPase
LPTFTVVAGANGAGKSTLTRLGREGFQECAVLDPDAVARSMQRLGVRSASPIDAGRSVLEMAEGYLKSGSSFLIETTLSGNTYLRMMARAKELGYLVVLLYVGTADVSINIQRVKIRVLKGGHDVPVEDQLLSKMRMALRYLSLWRSGRHFCSQRRIKENSHPRCVGVVCCL